MRASISEKNGQEVLSIITLNRSRISPVEDLGKQDELHDLLENGEGAIGCEPEPECEIVKIGSLTAQVKDGQLVPVASEGPEDRQSHDDLEYVAHERSVKEADHEPRDEDWDEESHLQVVPSLVPANIVQFVEDHVERDGTNSNCQAVQAVPAHSTSIVFVSNESAHTILSCRSVVVTFKLRVTHLLF
jgi:hypothetical protein